MRIATAWRTLVALALAASPAVGQDRNEVDRIVEAFFQNRNIALMEAADHCPGDDPLSDAIVASLTRPRPPNETRRLISAWGSVPECRVSDVLEWSARATRIIDNVTIAASLARVVMQVDSVQGLRVLRTAAADPLVPDVARGAYQVAVYSRLGPAELEALFIETFHGALQSGMYRHRAIGGLMMLPGAGEVALRVVAEVLDDPLNERASEVLGVILGVVTTRRDRFERADRQRLWTLIEPRLESLPPEMRELVESHAADLRGGPA